jgi:Mg/Co/Ni transporter MgtE
MTREQDILNSVHKKFQTTMIGSLAKFEKAFGYLWLQDNSNREKFEEIWDNTRNEILNNGNKQSRAAINELKEYMAGGLPFKKVEQYRNFRD